MLTLIKKSSRRSTKREVENTASQSNLRALSSKEIESVSGGKFLPPDQGGPTGPRWPNGADPRAIR